MSVEMEHLKRLFWVAFLLAVTFAVLEAFVVPQVDQSDQIYDASADDLERLANGLNSYPEPVVRDYSDYLNAYPGKLGRTFFDRNEN